MADQDRRTDDRRTDPERRKMGRPPVSPGEPSIQIGVVIGLSLFDRLRMIAQHEREELPTIVRQALAEFASGKLTRNT